MAAGLVDAMGGRYSAELGIDVGASEDEIERWFVAATLFGNRISANVAERTFRVLDQAGLHRIIEAGDVSWDELVALLDQGGYVRYDFRTATRLQDLADEIGHRYGGAVSTIATECPSPAQLEAALDALPGWGPVTVSLFLRELRGVWPNADPPLDPRARQAADHLGLLVGQRPALAQISKLAARGGLDVRDLEAALVRLSLHHRVSLGTCPGKQSCSALGGG